MCSGLGWALLFSVFIGTRSAHAQCSGDLGLAGISQGYFDGNVASLTVTTDGVDAGFDNSWMARGYNLVVFQPDTYAVHSTGSFDMYESNSGASASMLSFLQSAPAQSILVLLGQDAIDYWDSSQANLDPTLALYLTANYGAMDVSTLGFQDSYGLISVKGSSSASPLAETAAPSGTGQASVSATVVCNRDPVVAPTPAPVNPPTSAPTTSDFCCKVGDSCGICEVGGSPRFCAFVLWGYMTKQGRTEPRLFPCGVVKGGVRTPCRPR
jgi:hypothetical protein